MSKQEWVYKWDLAEEEAQRAKGNEFWHGLLEWNRADYDRMAYDAQVLRYYWATHPEEYRAAKEVRRRLAVRHENDHEVDEGEEIACPYCGESFWV